MDFFNSKGELNASDMQDAAQKLMRYASLLQENAPSNMSQVGQVSDDERDALVTKAIYSQDGKLALAQAMANPIRRNLDYLGFARRLLVVDPLAQGVNPVYHRDIDVMATTISSNGAAPESRVWSEAVTVPEFEVVSMPTVKIMHVRQRRYNMIDRAVQKARQEVMAVEDSNCLAALNASAEVENSAVSISNSGLTKADLGELKTIVDDWDMVTAKFVMKIREFNDILQWSSSGTNNDFDPVTHREVMQTGLYGKIWGADILVSKLVPAGNVFALADADLVGVLPVRQDIEVYPNDLPARTSLGWVVSEIIGIGILNPRAVAVGRKS
jgi:hypothetical protein